MVSRFAFVLVAALGALSSANVFSEEPPPASPLSPQQAIAEFRLPEDLKIELVACEPDVIDPVAIRFDERERMWVVEMGDYPHGPGEGEQPKSRIRILEDQDGDGRYELATTFADGLLFATGVQPWKDGAFVTMSGQIAFYRDADDDGKADSSDMWYTGFMQENSQLRANHPRLGMDGWIYVANGLRGGTVVDPSRPELEPLSISGMDFRFHPRTRQFEAVTGNGQFGMAFDDGGDRYTCSNRNPLRMAVIEDRYLKRSPLALIPETVHDVAAFGEASKLFPLTRAWTTSNLHAGQFTAACGVNFYRGDALPKEYYGDAFTCDPTGNLVHREKLASRGAVFESKPVHEGVEFLASRDEWFRPVNIENGPDGALYVVDMYRAVIEHPDFVPDELKNRPDQRLGDDRGRIWRITSANESPSRRHKLGGDLVSELSSENGWRRDAAARLLIQGEDLDTEAARAAVDIDHPSGLAAALWILHGRGPEALERKTLEVALQSASPIVKRQAILIAEQRFDASPDGKLRERIAKLANDDDARVRLQVLLSLAPAEASELPAIAHAARLGLADVWTRRAATIAAGERAGELAQHISVLPEVATLTSAEDVAGLTALFVDLAAQVGRTREAGQRQAFIEALTSLPNSPQARIFAALEACLITSSRNGAAPDDVLASLAPKVQERALGILSQASSVASDAGAEAPARIAAIGLAALAPSAGETIAQLALAEPDQEVRRQAIAMLARQAGLDPWRELVGRFPSESPTIRGAVLDGVLASADRTTLLLDAIAAGEIKPGEIDAPRTDVLLRHGDAALRARAVELLGAAPADRQKALADYQACLKLESDPSRGREIFAKNCAKCHRIGDLGVNVAPDISDSRVKTAEQYLTDILQPNRAIDSNYVSYTIITTDGRTLTGVLSQETATSVTLKQQEGKTVTLSREEIEEMRSSGVSLMPEGLEKDIPLQDMADLVAFIKNWRYLDGLTPLGAGK